MKENNKKTLYFYLLITLTLLLSHISAQIALPTFQGVHKVHSSVSSNTPENPLQSTGINEVGNYTWSYLLGYRFTPQVNGTITQLGGYYNGTYTVYLWRWSDGNFLGSVSHTSSSGWSYTNLGSSVDVSSGTEYFVAVAMTGCCGSYIDYGSNDLPNTYGNITINYAVYKSGNFNSNTMPSTFSSAVRIDRTWGMPDITFIPD